MRPIQPPIIGRDLAKSVFQVHGVDDGGKTVLTKRLRHNGVLTFFANLPDDAERRRLSWQRDVQYGRRSLGEVAMLRYKPFNGRSLRARTLPTQNADAAAGSTVLNITASLWMQVSRKVA